MQQFLSEKTLKVLRRYALTGDRTRLITALLDSASHHVIWISSWWDYRNIDQILTSLDHRKPHVMIYQTEEDWFHHLDFTITRNKIKQHSRWTDQSVIITNSRQDKEHSDRLGLAARCSPGLLDLIAYPPYDIGLLENTWSHITHHTGICLSRSCHDRMRLKELLDAHKNAVLISSLSSDHDLPTQYQLPSGSKDAPFVDIRHDAWITHIAFSVVLETRHRKSRFGFQCAPTLSEKTYKNMHFQRPAVICGGQYSRQYLRDLGFDTWDWLIDWSFDSESDDDVRFDKLLAEVKRLLDMPLQHLVTKIEQNQDLLLHNRDRLAWLISNHDSVDI